MNSCIVDDDFISRSILYSMLSNTKEFSNIYIFESGQDLIDSLPNIKQLDAVFLDIEMGGMNGIELALLLFSKLPNLLIIFVTSHKKYSIRAFEIGAVDYILKPYSPTKILRAISRIKHYMNYADKHKDSLYVKCFGEFEVFINDNPLLFSSKKAKELFALLIDKHGSILSSSEAIEILWEDRNIDAKSQSLYRVVLSRLTSTLKQYGFENIIKHVYGGCFIDTAKINCDYYNFLNSNFNQLNGFYGDYMSQYSWSENTHGTIVFEYQNYLLSYNKS